MNETKPSLRVAIVTGGHSFDVPNFHALFLSLAGEMDILIQSIDDFASSPEVVRDAYDVVVFYTMMMDGPSDEGHPWYAGKPKTALEHLGATRQGIVVLHHALLAYPKWPVWDALVGIKNRTFGFHIGETVTTHVAASDHPVTKGLADWTMIDETYSMADAGPDSEILLTYDHPKSMRTIAWTRQYRNSRVLCYEAGHDNRTWVDANFRTVLARGIAWASDRE